MMKSFACFLVVLCFVSFATETIGQQTQVEPRSTPEIQIDKKADELMHRMSDLLGKAKNISFRTKGTEERIRLSGKKVAVQVTREVVIRRPDGAWMHIVGQASDGTRD